MQYTEDHYRIADFLEWMNYLGTAKRQHDFVVKMRQE